MVEKYKKRLTNNIIIGRSKIITNEYFIFWFLCFYFIKFRLIVILLIKNYTTHGKTNKRTLLKATVIKTTLFFILLSNELGDQCNN